MNHVIKHSLGQELARKTILAAWSEYQNRFSKYRPTLAWSNPHCASIGFEAKGFAFRGSFEVRPASVAVTLDVPLVMRPFKGIALAAINREIESWIAKANAGEL
jgi:hypothetical protein